MSYHLGDTVNLTMPGDPSFDANVATAQANQQAFEQNANQQASDMMGKAGAMAAVVGIVGIGVPVLVLWLVLRKPKKKGAR